LPELTITPLAALLTPLTLITKSQKTSSEDTGGVQFAESCTAAVISPWYTVSFFAIAIAIAIVLCVGFKRREN